MMGLRRNVLAFLLVLSFTPSLQAADLPHQLRNVRLPPCRSFTARTLELGSFVEISMAEAVSDAVRMFPDALPQVPARLRRFVVGPRGPDATWAIWVCEAKSVNVVFNRFALSGGKEAQVLEWGPAVACYKIDPADGTLRDPRTGRKVVRSPGLELGDSYPDTLSPYPGSAADERNRRQGPLFPPSSGAPPTESRCPSGERSFTVRMTGHAQHYCGPTCAP
jgi:hypothetical protein